MLTHYFLWKSFIFFYGVPHASESVYDHHDIIIYHWSTNLICSFIFFYNRLMRSVNQWQYTYWSWLNSSRGSSQCTISSKHAHWSSLCVSCSPLPKCISFRQWFRPRLPRRWTLPDQRRRMCLCTCSRVHTLSVPHWIE